MFEIILLLMAHVIQLGEPLGGKLLDIEVLGIVIGFDVEPTVAEDSHLFGSNHPAIDRVALPGYLTA